MKVRNNVRLWKILLLPSFSRQAGHEQLALTTITNAQLVVSREHEGNTERESRTTARRHSHSRVAIAGPANVAYLFMDPGCLPGSSYQNTRPIVKGPTAVNSMVDDTYIDSSYSRTWERSDFGDVLLYSMWKNRRSSIIISMYKLPNRTAAEDVNIYRKLESSFFSRPAASLLFR